MKDKHKHKKKYGQNFLNNPQVLFDIMDVTNIEKNETILEIGPGDGAMTEHLLEKADKVICVEIDRDLEARLIGKFDKNPQFELIMKDVLNLDFESEIGEKVKVVANIPYYITGLIINKLIENREYVDEIYLMVQKEVGKRIAAKPGTKDCGLLTYSVNYFGKGEYLFEIPKEDFDPVPKVDSAFVKIDLSKEYSKENDLDEKTFFKYAKKAFANKRKNIVNNLTNVGFAKSDLNVIFEENNINRNLRAEDFSVEEFIKLVKILEEKKVSL